MSTDSIYWLLLETNEILTQIHVLGLFCVGTVTAVLVCFLLYRFIKVFTKEENKMSEFAITAELVAPITEAINSGLTTLVPIGLGIMATFIGLGLIPRIIYKFL